MADILHRVGIKASLADVYHALTTPDGLAGWWTSNTQGDGHVGGVLQFRFGVGGFMHHCSTKWALFLMSLKAFGETGKGFPDPHDVKIDNWN
jgi:hypothetical protein